MELRHLRYFVVLAEELHFGRAANRLGISQPPLSQQIQALEAELDVPLLDRNSRKVALTAAGTAFLAEARQTLTQAGRAVTMAKRAAAGTIGLLRVGFTPSVPFMELFPLVMRRYRQEFPEVEIRLMEMITRHQLDAMAENRLDVGFIRAPLPPVPPDVLTMPALTDRLVLIARGDHRFAAMASVPIAELKGEPMIMMEREAGTGLYGHVHSLCAVHGFAPTVAQEARGAWTPIGLVAAGLGVSILYSSLVARLTIADVVQRPIDVPNADGQVLFAHRTVMDPPALEFTRLVRTAIG